MAVFAAYTAALDGVWGSVASCCFFWGPDA
jgi:hypothetical protein